MKTVETISINGTMYAVPAGISQAELVKLSGTLLLLQRIDYHCDSEYRKSFHYLEAERAAVRFGTITVHGTSDEAKAARDAHNLTLAPQAETA